MMIRTRILRAILLQLALMSGLASVGGAIFFFQRFFAYTYVSVVLVSLCVGLVIIVGVLWVASFSLWLQARRTEEEYWDSHN